MNSRRTGLRIISSFLLCALCLVAMYRLIEEERISSQVAIALAIIAILAVAAAWRGILYLRLLRVGSKL